jgi:hypothetical protein
MFGSLHTAIAPAPGQYPVKAVHEESIDDDVFFHHEEEAHFPHIFLS